jgi:hypothetical protein
VDRRAAIAVLAGALVAVLFAAITTAGEVRLIDGPPTFFDDAEPGVLVPPPQDDETLEDTAVAEREDREPSPLVELIARVLVWGALAFAAAVALALLWRHRPTFERRRRRRERDRPLDVLADVATTITDSAGAQRAALRRGSPRNAIVECWLLLEAAVIAAGVERRPADTSTELTERVLADRDVDAAAIAALAALYREARFSDHEMSESSRRAAIDALDRVHGSLGRSARGSRGTPQRVDST